MLLMKQAHYRCDKLCDELSAVSAGRSIDSYAPEATLFMPCCAGNQKLLRMNGMLQRQPREFQVDTSVQAA